MQEPAEGRLNLNSKFHFQEPGCPAAPPAWICDPILIHELVEPGSDLRWGVNVLCRPESPLADIIVSVQNRLRELEPGQYYYPVQDLHLTVSEICHSMKPAEAHKIAINVEKCTDALFTDLAAFELHSPAIVFDAHGCALNFNLRLPFKRWMKSGST